MDLEQQQPHTSDAVTITDTNSSHCEAQQKHDDEPQQKQKEGDDMMEDRGRKQEGENTKQTLARYKKLAAKLKSVLESTQKELKEKEQEVEQLKQQRNFSLLEQDQVQEEEETSKLDVGATHTELLDTGRVKQQVEKASTERPGELKRQLDVKVLCRVELHVHKHLQEFLGEDGNGKMEGENNNMFSIGDEEANTGEPQATIFCYCTVVENNELISYGWVREKHLLSLFPFDISLPRLCPSSDDYDKLQTQLSKTMKKLHVVQEEYRKYRVKAETLLRQNETDAERRSLTRQPEEFPPVHDEADSSKGKSTDDMQADELRREVNALKKALQDARDERTAWQFRCQEIEQELQSNARNGTTSSSWLSSLTQSLADSTQRRNVDDHHNGRPFQHPSTPGDSNDADVQLAVVQRDFTRYRKRAMELLKEKDEALQETQEKNEELRKSAAEAEYRSSTLEHEVHELRRKVDELKKTPPSAAEKIANSRNRRNTKGTNVHDDVDATGLSPSDHQYLCNIIVNYLSTNDDSVREKMEIAIATILGLNLDQVKDLQAKRKIVTQHANSGIAQSLWENASSLLSSPSRSPTSNHSLANRGAGQEHPFPLRESGARNSHGTGSGTAGSDQEQQLPPVLNFKR